MEHTNKKAANTIFSYCHSLSVLAFRAKCNCAREHSKDTSMQSFHDSSSSEAPSTPVSEFHGFSEVTPVLDSVEPHAPSVSGLRRVIDSIEPLAQVVQVIDSVEPLSAAVTQNVDFKRNYDALEAGESSAIPGPSAERAVPTTAATCNSGKHCSY